MGVTIDTISIEIESSSIGAAKGIDALAKSLEGLKKNGSFSTVSKNLNNLSDALKGLPNVYQASNSLRTLTNSIEKLKGVGSIAGIANSLKKLPEGLSALGKIDLDAVAPQIEKVAAAVAPLSAVKAGGLNTMMNSLKKLGEVTKSLDKETIDAFADKIAQLNEKLGPLSQKMSTIKTGFNAINQGARKAEQGVKELKDEINTTTLNLSNFIDVAGTMVDGIRTLVQMFANFMHEATQWDGIEYQFGNAFGEQADMYYEKITKITDALSINKQMFMENTAMATSMLVGFGVNAKDAREMGLGYTELAYDIWAAFNNVYNTLDGADGAMAAVRSAIAGEVEPIRRAGFTIVESTLEQTAANHGLKISIETATEAQKSYLRYLSLVDQAHSKGIVGTYASEMETAEGMVRTLSQQWKSLTQSFASLFIPILVKVLPYIQAFVDLLKEGVYWFAELLGVEIQAVDFSDYKTGANAIENVANSANGATGALNDATEAAKELKNATLGIDELNVISPTSASSGSGSGGSGSGAGSGFEGFDVGSLWDETIFDTIQSDVDAIKEKMRGWMPIVGSVAAALAGLRLVKLLDDIGLIEKSKLFNGGLKLNFGSLKNFTDWIKAFTELAREGGIIAALGAAFPKLSKALKNLTGNFSAFFALAKEGGVVQALAAAFPKLSTAISGVGTFLAGISAPVWAGIAAAVVAVGSAIYFLIENWDAMKQAVSDFFAANISPKLDEMAKHFDKIKEALGPIWEDILMPLVDLVVNIPWDSVKEAAGSFFETIGWYITTMSTLVGAGALNAIVQFVEGIVQAISGGIQVIRGIVDFWIALFTGGDLMEPIKKIGDGILDIFGGLYSSTIGVIVEFVKGIISWFEEMWDVLVGHSIVPDTINAIVDWFVGLPGKVLGSVGNFVKDVIGKFSNLGSGLSEKFSSAWNTVKSWWGKKPSLSSYTPSIGSIYDKLKERWDNARIWWNDKKTKAKEYTPSIGSIYEKLYDRWKNARDWWNSKKGSMSYTPSIGSIKDKIVSAWNTAKKWWSSNASLSAKLNISVPKLTVNWGEVSALGKTFKYPKSFSVKFAAKGGIFDQGSLIWAGERGPEVMAEASGGRTGVMNVQQMQDAVYEGVYAAVSAAMRGMNGGGSGQDVRVYLDGREISSSVRKHQHESGATIMGNEVYAY